MNKAINTRNSGIRNHPPHPPIDRAQQEAYERHVAQVQNGRMAGEAGSPVLRESDVPQQIGNLMMEVCEAEKLADHIESRLSPVLLPQPVSDPRINGFEEPLRSPLGSSLAEASNRLAAVRGHLSDLMDRLQLLLPFLLLIGLAPTLSASPRHHLGWKSNPHHAKGLTQFVHSPKFRATAPAPDIVDLSGCMPDSGTVSAPLAMHMPGIYDQGQEGSCTANAGTAAMEFLWHKTFGSFLSGSRQGLYSCSLTHDGNWPNDAGSFTATVVWVLQNQGQGGEQLFPYNTPLNTPLPDFYVADAAQHRTVHAYDVDSTDHASLQTALASGLPVMFGGYVYPLIETLTPDSYFNAPHSGDPLGGHERLICGYNRTLKHTYQADTLFGHDVTVTGFYWVRNSWGTGWGSNGYCWEPMSEIENPQVYEDFAVVDVAAVPVPEVK